MPNKLQKTITYGNHLVVGILLVLSVLAVIKNIFVSFDIDEGYAIAQAYRLLMGDKLIMDMWEPHQLSAYAAALFMLPYLWITGGSTTGIVIYLRIIGTLIHVLLAYGFYRTSRKRFNSTISLFIAMVHLNFLSKWIILPEFEIMQYWASCIVFLSLLSWYEKAQKKYLLIAGTFFFSMLFTYPTMILLYPAYLVVLFCIKKEPAKKCLISSIWFTLPSLILGIAFLLYLLSYMSINEFLKYVTYIFMDESHSVSLAIRMAGYGKELLLLLEQLLSYLPSAIGFLLIVVIIQIWGEKKGFWEKEQRKSSLLLAILFIILGLFLAEHIRGSLLEDNNQFYLYYRFLLISVVGIAGTFLSRQYKHYFWLGILPGMIGVIASALITNMTLEIANARLYIGVMASCFIIAGLLQEKYGSAQLLKALCYINMVLFIGGLLICKLILVRVTGCLPVTIRMPMAQVTEGPVAGIWVHETLAKQYNENIPLLRQYIEDGDRLLYFGCEHVYYLASAAEIATPSVQGTAIFNEMFTSYYAEHPDKQPNVVFVDKTFPENPAYRYSEENQYMLDWITEHFADAKVYETENITIYKLN